ncbi:toll-like receptor 8 [Pseudophryne corroboree]|uniref:toll-like receptor 8 n=1 Tax=Pseudophryne corroboree TaxID=495146 RepID=UPI003081EFE9
MLFNLLSEALIIYIYIGLCIANADNRTFPCTIEENNSSVVFDCHARRLKNVPSPITYLANSVQLLLSENYLQTIPNTAFRKWHNLTKLDLSSNYKQYNTNPCEVRLVIGDKTFTNLTTLKQLIIDNNNLHKIPTGLPISLSQLSLRYNNISSVNKKSFSQVKLLKELYLDHNCYYGNSCPGVFEIQDEPFFQLQELTVLSLSYNNLAKVPPKLPSSLKELYLSSNKINVIDREDFISLTNLEILHLSGNCPRCFNSRFPCKPCVGQTSLKIHPYAFQNLNKLLELNLGNASLTSVSSLWFLNTTRLKVLNLARNYLVKEMASADFLVHLPYLQKLDLSFNYEIRKYFKYINLSDNFSKLLSLQELHIEGYVFQEITSNNIAPLSHISTLNIINFGVNFIRQVDLKVFQKFKNLTLIYLSDNRISPYSERGNQSRRFKRSTSQNIQRRSTNDDVVHTASFTETVNWSGQIIKPLCSLYGKTLDLSSNSIFYIAPEEFSSLSDVACVNLSHNYIDQNLNGTEFIYLSNVTYLDLSYNKLDFDSSTAFKELPKLKGLDLSHNSKYFVEAAVTHNLQFIHNLPSLEVLNLSWNGISTLTEYEMNSISLKELRFSGNRLDVMWSNWNQRYLDIFKNFTNLSILDLSRNRLVTLPEKIVANFPANLTELYLNHNIISFWEWKTLEYIQYLELLDLSYNRLTTLYNGIYKYTSSLQRLLLSNNLISSLPDGFLYKAYSLTALDLSYNHIQNINKSVFLFGKYNYLKVLWVKGNPFDCTCEIVDFLQWIRTNNVTIPLLATDVRCAVPDYRKAKSIIYFDIHACSLDATSLMLFFMSFSAIVLIIILSTMKHLFYWDVWYVYHWCMAKLKLNKVRNSEKLYDAFITYDETDPAVTDWVFNELCYQLEVKGEKHILLCLEERDWEPGKAVIDNIIESINQSKKTVFVLTKKYVKSGKFRTAFYLAMQKLMDENMDVIVIVLLQPVLQQSQYLRLRKKICSSSILEWPKNPHAEDFFWQTMKNVLVTENSSRYNNLYTASVAT